MVLILIAVGLGVAFYQGSLNGVIAGLTQFITNPTGAAATSEQRRKKVTDFFGLRAGASSSRTDAGGFSERMN